MEKGKGYKKLLIDGLGKKDGKTVQKDMTKLVAGSSTKETLSKHKL